MSFIGASERNAVALQVAETLDAYEAALDEWLIDPSDMHLFGKASAQIEAARLMSSSALPSATGALTALLLAHTDLICTVWKTHMAAVGQRRTHAQEQKLARAIAHHRVTISEMRLLCVRLSTRGRDKT